jgi:hypothetical protein
MTFSCDTVDGIHTYLGDLAGLHLLIKARCEAYDRSDRGSARLGSFIILGRWATDSCGNFGRCEIKSYSGDASWIAGDLPPVVRMDDLQFLKNLSVTTTYDGSPPHPNSLCVECGTGWTIETSHDFEPRSMKDTHDRVNGFKHSYCHKLSAERDVLQEFRGLLEKAGLGRALFTAIPNEYWRDDGEPWFLARMPFGTLKIGWRKRVISIDWAEVLADRMKRIERLDVRTRYELRQKLHEAFDGKKLFPNEDVTRWETGIHAWGADKAVEYLKVLGEKVLCKPVTPGWQERKAS